MRGSDAGIQLLVNFAEYPFDHLDDAVGSALETLSFALFLGCTFLPQHLPPCPAERDGRRHCDDCQHPG